MNDRMFFAGAALLAVVLIAVAVAWPTGDAAGTPGGKAADAAAAADRAA